MLPAVRESFNLVEVERRAGHEQHDAEGEDAVGRIQHWHLQGFGTEAAFGLGPALFVARDPIGLWKKADFCWQVRHFGI